MPINYVSLRELSMFDDLPAKLNEKQTSKIISLFEMIFYNITVALSKSAFCLTGH